MKKVALVSLLCIILSCEAVFVEDISNDSLILLAPVDNSEITSGNNTFSWQLLDEAEMYEIQIARPSFQNAAEILLDSVVDSNSLVHNIEIGEYEWRVKAVNSEYETEYSTSSFTVN